MTKLWPRILDGLVHRKDLFRCLLQLNEPSALLFWTLTSHPQQKKWKSSLT